MIISYLTHFVTQSTYQPMMQNNDGTFALKVGVYKFKSKFDDGEMVDVRVEKRDVTAVAAMEVEV